MTDDQDFDLTSITQPKSDQLNADDLIGGPRTITVTRVRKGNAEQRMWIYYEGDGGKPFKPCLSMIRVILFAWGTSAKACIGKSMTLYRDPTAKYGGKEVGGIRISHMSHIERDLEIALTVTRGKREPFIVRRLVDVPQVKASKPVEPTQAPGNIEQARAMLTTADVETVETILVSLREFSWTRDEKLEIKRLSDEATKRKRLSNG